MHEQVAGTALRDVAVRIEVGVESAVTTRRMLFDDYAERLIEPPRILVKRRHSAYQLEILLTGAPFRVWSRSRRVAA